MRNFAAAEWSSFARSDAAAPSAMETAPSVRANVANRNNAADAACLERRMFRPSLSFWVSYSGSNFMASSRAVCLVSLLA